MAYRGFWPLHEGLGNCTSMGQVIAVLRGEANALQGLLDQGVRLDPPAAVGTAGIPLVTDDEEIARLHHWVSDEQTTQFDEGETAGRAWAVQELETNGSALVVLRLKAITGDVAGFILPTGGSAASYHYLSGFVAGAMAELGEEA